jgi:hypothetical protein
VPDALNFPAYALRTRVTAQGKEQVYDPLRRKYVRLTPEEWVRQHTAQYLIQALGTPPGLVGVEVPVGEGAQRRRADLVAHDRRGRPLLLAECKAPAVAITQATFDQAARYNRVADAPFLLVTNGLAHYACHIERAAGRIRFLDDLPPYEDLLARAATA